LGAVLDVRRLGVLCEDAARGSSSAAAESLNATRSVVAQQLAALEREAGTALWNQRPSKETRCPSR
jgi:DNA-binding transcriptional LysR family regulator